MTKQIKIATKPKRLILFTQNFRKRISAHGLEEVKNLESFLNRKHDDNDELILDSTDVWYRNKSGTYLPKSRRNYIAIKCNQIDFVYASKKIEEQIYAPIAIPLKSQMDVMYGLHKLKHDLIGEIKLPTNNLPKNEKEKLIYLSKNIKNKSFIQFYNPRQRRIQKEFNSLFDGTLLQGKKLDKILLNRTGYTVNSKSIYSLPGKQ
jgi:hypothetical protein